MPEKIQNLHNVLKGIVRYIGVLSFICISGAESESESRESKVFTGSRNQSRKKDFTEVGSRSQSRKKRFCRSWES